MAEDVDNKEKVFAVYFGNETDQMLNSHQVFNMTDEVGGVVLLCQRIP